LSKATEVEEILKDIKEVVTGKHEDDVLELTEIINEDGSTTAVEDVQVVNNMSEVASSQDNIDSLFDDPTPKEEIKEDVAQEQQQFVKNNVVEEAVVASISDNSIQASMEPIRDLMKKVHKQTSDGLAFNSGTTVEEIVTELMKPKINEWLDANLPGIVKSVVEKEIKKIIPRDE
jgi:cell pole-organizing protein PopZ